MLSHVVPIDEALSMRITPTTERPPLVRGPIAALMRESVADRMIVGAVSVGAPAFETWTSPFPSRVSLRLGKTVVTEALKNIHDAVQLLRR